MKAETRKLYDRIIEPAEPTDVTGNEVGVHKSAAVNVEKILIECGYFIRSVLLPSFFLLFSSRFERLFQFAPHN